MKITPNFRASPNYKLSFRPEKLTTNVWGPSAEISCIDCCKQILHIKYQHFLMPLHYFLKKFKVENTGNKFLLICENVEKSWNFQLVWEKYDVDEFSLNDYIFHWFTNYCWRDQMKLTNYLIFGNGVKSNRIIFINFKILEPPKENLWCIPTNDYGMIKKSSIKLCVFYKIVLLYNLYWKMTF